jgi:hypothetical protein
MQRLNSHLAVADLEKSIRFYSGLFHAEPTVCKPDHARWMLCDPRINFVISTRSGTVGLDHLGIQVESEEELEAMNHWLTVARQPVEAQKQAACCYAESDEYRTVDPQGIAWETFQTLNAIPMFGEDAAIHLEPVSACCQPASGEKHA